MELSSTEDRDAESLLLYRFLSKNLTFHSSFQAVERIYLCEQTVTLDAPLGKNANELLTEMNC